MTKLILKGDESRDSIANGILELANIVGKTIGPKGKNVITLDASLNPLITNDGVTIANDIHFQDEFMEMGANIVRQAAQRTNTIAGDGTTTTTVLAASLIKHIIDNNDEIDILKTKKYLAEIEKSAIKTIDSMTKKVLSNKRIQDVATISSQDVQVGKEIAKIFADLGKNAEIVVEDGFDNSGITSHSTKGIRFDSGYIHPNFVNDTLKGEVVLTNTDAIIIQGKVQSMQDVVEYAKYLHSQAKKNLVIFAEDFSQDFINTCWTNHLNNAFTIIPVRIPAKIHNFVQKLDLLIDCGVNTLPLQEVQSGVLQKIQINKTHTSLVHNNGSEEAPGIGVIKVAMPTAIATTEKSLRVEDAINATKRAIEGGVVAGGGVTLLRCGIEPLDKPFKLILENAGYDKEGIVKECIKVLNNKKGPDYGYDMSNEEMELINMTKNGIIDPAIVVKECVKNACSIAGVVLSTAAVIVNEFKK